MARSVFARILCPSYQSQMEVGLFNHHVSFEHPICLKNPKRIPRLCTSLTIYEKMPTVAEDDPSLVKEEASSPKCSSVLYQLCLPWVPLQSPVLNLDADFWLAT